MPGIFQISENTPDNNQETTPDNTPKEEPTDATVSAGEKTEVSPLNKGGVDEVPKDKAETVIQLSGPLSHVYTQTLNMLLANEDMITTIAAAQNAQKTAAANTEGVYVYVTNIDDLDFEKMHKHYLEIENMVKDRPVAPPLIVGMESDKPNMFQKIFKQMLKPLNAKVTCSRQETLRAITSATIRKK